jgi:hypothetical protein
MTESPIKPESEAPQMGSLTHKHIWLQQDKDGTRLLKLETHGLLKDKMQGKPVTDKEDKIRAVRKIIKHLGGTPPPEPPPLPLSTVMSDTIAAKKLKPR